MTSNGRGARGAGRHPARRGDIARIALRVFITAIVTSWWCAAPARATLPGDANCNSRLESDDVQALVDNLFGPVVCTDADANQDTRVTAADLPSLLSMLSTPAPGPIVTFFGVASSAGDPMQPVTISDDGLPIFVRPVGVAFKLVIEGRPGLNGVPAGREVEPASGRPDLQLETDQALGDGSYDVCPGRVSAIDPPDFGAASTIDQALRAFACGFQVSTTRISACTVDSFGNAGWVAANSQTQFCTQIQSLRQFPNGQTRLTGRLLDLNGTPGPIQRIIIQIGTTPPPTRTATPTTTPAPPTRTATPTTSPTPLPTATFTRGVSPTATASATRSTAPSTPTFTPSRTPTTPGSVVTATPTLSATATTSPRASSTPTFTVASPSPSNSQTATATATAQRPSSTATRTATRTATASVTLSASATLSRTATGTPTRTRTFTPLPSFTPTVTPTVVLAPTVTPTRSQTPQLTRTPTPSRTPTFPPTPTLTPQPGSGPIVTFRGISLGDDSVPASIGSAGGIPIYNGLHGTAFSLVIEGRPGSTNQRLGDSVYNYDPSDPTARPDLQVEINRPLGDGSRQVCDNSLPMIGGVPGFSSPDFSMTQVVSDALNDIGCRFLTGSGVPGARTLSDACTTFSDGSFHFVNSHSTLQFCGGPVVQGFAFPPGDTLVTVQLRDQAMNVGAPAQMIIRVAN